MASDLFHLLAVEDNEVVLKYGACIDKTYPISSLEALRGFLRRRAKALGVDVTELKVMCSSSMDFPEEETGDEGTIELAHTIRPGGWLTVPLGFPRL